MTTLFKLKKATAPGHCNAMRCKKEGVGEYRIGDSDRELCALHLNVLRTHAKRLEESGIVETTAAIIVSEHETAGAKVVGWTERKAVGTWLSRVHEVVQELESAQAEGADVLALAAEYEVRSQADLVEIGAWTQDAKLRLKDISEKEKEITGPLATALSRIRDLCRPAKQVWVDAEAVLRAHLVAAKLREAENNRQAVTEAASAHAAGTDATAIMSKVITTTDIAGVSLKLRWKAVVENVMLLPEGFYTRIPNEKKLKEHCSAAGDAEPAPIPGVRFEQDVASRITAPKAVVL